MSGFNPKLDQRFLLKEAARDAYQSKPAYTFMNEGRVNGLCSGDGGNFWTEH